MLLTTIFSTIGLVLNVCFIIIICIKKRTKNFQSSKPYRHLLIAILISDIWFLINKSNIKNFYGRFTINVTSYNGICQLNAYLNFLFSVLLEFNLLFGSLTLFRITFNKKDSEIELHKSQYDKEQRNIKTSNKNLTNIKDLDEIISVQQKHMDTNSSGSLETEKLSNLISVKKKQSLSSTISASIKSKTKHGATSLLSNFKYDYWKRVRSKQFRLEEVYYNLIITEKQFIALNAIFWIYMNSFIFWIHGVDFKNKKDLDSDLIESTSSMLKTVFSKKYANNVSLNGTGTTEYRIVSEKPICKVYEFAEPFYKVFTTCIIFLRFFTLCVNLFTTILHHVKFRNEYSKSILEVFKSDISSESNLKLLNFKIFNVFYTTKVSYNQNFKLPSEKNRNTKSHYDHIHFLRHYAKIILIYSLLIAPDVINETITSTMGSFQSNSFEKRVKKVENRRKALMLLELLSFTDESSNNTLDSAILRELNKNLTTLNTTFRNNSAFFKIFTDFNNYNQASPYSNDHWLKVFIKYSSLFAYSTKFIVYFIFSYHIKLFFSK